MRGQPSRARAPSLPTSLARAPPRPPPPPPPQLPLSRRGRTLSKLPELREQAPRKGETLRDPHPGRRALDDLRSPSPAADKCLDSEDLRSSAGAERAPGPCPVKMLVRKVPGFVPASPWGLRLPQKFVFLLFLSGLVTLCFGALFLLPNSSRLKRLFLAPRTQQPGLEAVAQVASHPRARGQESPPNPAPAAPAPGKDDPGSQASSRRRKGWLRRTHPTGPREEATAARGGGATALRPQEGSVPSGFDFKAFRSRLRHPVLGTRTDRSKEPQSLVHTQREKIKEVRTLLLLPQNILKDGSCASIHPPSPPVTPQLPDLLEALLPNFPPSLLPAHFSSAGFS